MKRAALYVRVSTDQQTVENQLLVLNEVAQRSGWTIVHTFSDEGVSGAKGRDKRPGYDALLKAVSRHEVQIVAAWSVDRLGRSLPDLVSFLSDIQAKGCDLYLHQQAIDTSTPSASSATSRVSGRACKRHRVRQASARMGQQSQQTMWTAENRPARSDRPGGRPANGPFRTGAQ